MRAMREMGNRQETTSCLCHGAKGVKRRLSTSPTYEVEEPVALHAKFHPAFPLKRSQRGGLIPGRYIHSRLVNIDLKFGRIGPIRSLNESTDLGRPGP